MNTNPNSANGPALQVIDGAATELDADLDAMVREICLRPFDDKTWAFADQVLDRQAPRGRLKAV